MCKRYSIDNSQRHGALLDAEILADVYLAMTGGQTTLALEVARSGPDTLTGEGGERSSARQKLKVLAANEQEIEAHEARLDALEVEGGLAVWRTLQPLA